MLGFSVVTSLATFDSSTQMIVTWDCALYHDLCGISSNPLVCLHLYFGRFCGGTWELETSCTVCFVVIFKIVCSCCKLLNCPTVYSYQLVTVMQAQKVLGNKWTEIAKVVSGRCVFLIGLLFIAIWKKDKNEICELRFMAYVFLGLATTELTMQWRIAFLLCAKGGPRMRSYTKKMVCHVPTQMQRGFSQKQKAWHQAELPPCYILSRWGI